jgi:hypothetical protein
VNRDSRDIQRLSKWVVCAATPSSGVRHRFAMLSSVKCFADHFGYSVCMLWGVTPGVAFCRFEELFSPVPGIGVVNIPAAQLTLIAERARNSRDVAIADHRYSVFHAGEPLHDRLFSWNLDASGALARLAAPNWRQIAAVPARPIRDHTNAYARRYGIENRIGIRVRVEEGRTQRRKPRRVIRELNETIKSIARIPWHAKVFVATDSEYVQTMLASHFRDVQYLPKKFDLKEPTGRYVHRQDKLAMVIFLKEVDCLCRCKRIVNIGGFLNERSVQHRIIEAPYDGVTLLTLARR